MDVRRAVSLAHKHFHAATKAERRCYVMEVFGCAGEYANGLCRRFGLDPDKVLTPADPVEWGRGR